MDRPSLLLCVAALAAPVFGQGAARVEQIATKPARTPVRVAPVAADRSSSAQSVVAQGPGQIAVSAETLAACRAARAQDRAAPKGVDCVKALQAPIRQTDAQANRATAETALLAMFGPNQEMGSAPIGDAAAANADSVARQLSSGGFEGTSGSDAAARVARDRAPPATAAPPPR